MQPDVMDELDRRLRAARPRTARTDESAFDAELLARVRDLPIAARRSVPRAVAVPVAAGVTLTVTAVVMLGGGPGEVGGPSSAAAVTQALHWLTPSAGTILHARSIETTGTHTTTREFWQSADRPASARMRTEGARSYEVAGAALYDPTTDTIYDGFATPADAWSAPDDAKRAAKKLATKGTDANRAAEKFATTGKHADRAAKQLAITGMAASDQAGDVAPPAGDPIVEKARILLQEGHLEITGRAVHNGVDAWAISLKPDAGRPVWTLWVSAADGKPLELRDPGRDASEQPQVVRWPTYEVLPGSDADQVLTLTGAHPSARVVHDPAQAAAAEQRLLFDAP